MKCSLSYSALNREYITMTYDNLDSQLINALLGDGRASLRSLGEELDVSVTTVSNHINDLEAKGVIEGYTPIIDYGELGLRRYCNHAAEGRRSRTHRNCRPA